MVPEAFVLNCAAQQLKEGFFTGSEARAKSLMKTK
jgi:hypothetical protein